MRGASVRGRAKIEVSGGITPENLLDYVKLNPGVVSMGYLTHSAKPVDLSLEVICIRGAEDS
ncbi:MAG: hypothetical protein DRN99_04825 [Thermoproteota archaeon]|nr:MAG: hypothetical protein DRN99_04825 [Candidatus Korarchaeota archaeon]